MKTVVSAKDVEELIRSGGRVDALPADALLTPSARDLLRDWAQGAASAQGTAARPSAPARPVHSKSPPAELEAYFESGLVRALKEQICDVGRRLWQRAYVD